MFVPPCVVVVFAIFILSIALGCVAVFVVGLSFDLGAVMASLLVHKAAMRSSFSIFD